MFTCWLILLQPIRLLMMIVIMRWVHLHFGSQDLRLTKFLVRLFEGLGLSVSVGGLDGQFNLWNGRSFHHHPLWCGEDTAPGAASDALSAVHNRHDLTTGHLVNGGMDRQDSDRTQMGLRGTVLGRWGWTKRETWNLWHLATIGHKAHPCHISGLSIKVMSLTQMEDFCTNSLHVTSWNIMNSGFKTNST